MTRSRPIFILTVLSAGLIAGLATAFTLHWSRAAVFPAYGYVVDLLAVPAVIALILHARKLKAQTTDEFAETKMRYGTSRGFRIGLGLFLLSNLFPIAFPHAYHAFMLDLGTPEDGYAIGRVAGFAPFIIGLVIGQIAAWLKYR